MGWITKVGNLLTGGLVRDVGEAIDKNVTSDEERMQLKNEFQEIVQEYQVTIEQEITKRHQADMKSDSWLSKNIRPMSLIFLLGAVTLFAFGDGLNWLSIEPIYISLYEKLLIVAFAFYFGGRSIEKWQAIRGQE